MRLALAVLFIILLTGCSDATVTGNVISPNGSNTTNVSEPIPAGTAPLTGGQLVRVDLITD